MGYRYNFKFCKTGSMIYISHLDLIRLFGRAMRRAGLPIALTEGYNPHPKFKLKKALKLGVSSLSEEAEVVLKKEVKPGEVCERLQKELPEGISINEINCQKF